MASIEELLAQPTLEATTFAETEANSLPVPSAVEERAEKRVSGQAEPKLKIKTKRRRRVTKAEKQKLAEAARRRKEEEMRQHEIDLCKAQAPGILVRNCPVTINLAETSSDIFVEGNIKEEEVSE